MYKQFLYKLFAIFPLLETIFRNLYWRLLPSIPSLKKFSNSTAKTHSIPNISIHYADQLSEDIVLDYMYDYCIEESETLLVHSNLSLLNDYRINAGNFADKFISRHIQKGTLAVPTFPILRHQVNSKNRLLPVPSGLPLPRFQLSSNRISTGLLGKRLLSTPGTVRSKIPINNLSANGYFASAIFESESLYHQSPFPCGIHSSWYALAQLSAKLLFINCPPVHTCTMIHVAEDTQPEFFSQFHWYWEREYEINDADRLSNLFTYERHPKVSMSYCESKFHDDLLVNNILREFKLGSIYFGVIDSDSLLDFITSRPNVYPYYGIWMSTL